MFGKFWHPGIVLILSMVFVQCNPLMGQTEVFYHKADSVYLTYDSIIVFRDSVLIPTQDTLILIEEGIHYKVKKNNFRKSQAFYDSVYEKTHGRKLTKELYNFLLSYKPDDKTQNDGQHTVAGNSFEKYQGKTIRNIRFIKVDVLEGSVQDTLKKATSNFGKILNKTHVNTHTWVLKKFLLIKPGDEVITGILADNERVIRNIPAIEDVKFVIEEDTLNSEVVDLIIVTKDVFPIAATASASSFDNFSASLWSTNSFGLAYELGGSLLYNGNFSDRIGYELFTKYRNLWGTFIDGSLAWTDAFNTQWLRLNLNKEFLTPQTKYGGGVNIGWIRDQYELVGIDSVFKGTFESDYQDIWLGRSFLLGNKSSRENMIISARFEREEFLQRPFVNPDSNEYYHNKNIYYGKVAYTKIGFYKTNMVKSYGIAENIPFGINTAITVAYLDSDFLQRLYLGGSIGAADYFDKFGYLAGNIILGGFYKSGQLSQGLIESNLLYYTPLLTINRYKTRSFLRLRYIKAITRDIQTNINFDDFIRNLKDDNIGGQSTLIFNYEGVLFSPWYFYGFRFAPFVFADMGLVTGSNNAFFKSSLYSALGIGFRIRNESLAFKTIILSFGFLPNTASGNGEWFFNFSMGEDALVPILENDRPFILRRELILPY